MMPEPCFSFLGSKQPRMFFTLCLILSVIIVIVSGLFFYFPKDLGLSSGGYEYTVAPESHSHSFHEKSYMSKESRVGVGGSNGHGGHDENKGVDVDGDMDPLIAEYSDPDEDYHIEGQEGPADLDYFKEKIRHQAHNHHGRPAKILSLEEVKSKSVMSNVIETRLIHLDLKGAPPKMSYIKEVLKIARHAGINGLLVEWEDTFPWKRSLTNLSLTEGSYSMDDVEEIVYFAEKILGLEVIPLVQTFGHVEFVLKGAEFRELREVDQDPQSFCPSKSGTMRLVKEMIDQTLEVHKNARFVHIGCDEVYNLRICPLCTAAAEYKEDIFLKHVTEVASYVRLRGRIPIIWDDMLRSISLQKLNNSGIGSLLEPMVWVYAEDVDRFVGWDAWEKYAAIFPSVWGAAAFKGAFGETLSIPPLSRHAENTQRWIDVITRESHKWSQGVAGLVLTGWMRYDHFSVLCEILPATLPSLVYSSLLTSIPASSAHSIKNRLFVPKSEHIEESSTPADQQMQMNQLLSSPPSPLLTEELSADVEEPPRLLVKRSSPHEFRSKLSHPRALMAKDVRLAKFGSHHSPPSGHVDIQIYDKGDKVSRAFCQILTCPTPNTRLDNLLRGADTDLSFAARCNFPGVAFFRVLFRLRALLHESWELVAKINRKRGWMTPYNIRHNYSLPLRVDELVGGEVARLRRQLELCVRSVETSLKPLFPPDVIAEWIEQNIWDAWKELRELERAAEVLKNVGVWPRRPVKAPREMIYDLRLFGISPLDQPDEL